MVYLTSIPRPDNLVSSNSVNSMNSSLGLSSNCVRTVQLHLVERAGDIWKSHLKFRDELIANPNLALKYLKLKETLARQFSNDRDAYTLGKAEFIESVINSARNPKL